MEVFVQGAFRWGWLSVLLALAGCGSGGSVTKVGNLDLNTLRAMSNFYLGYQESHRGQPPKDEQTFREFLNGQQAALEAAGLTVDRMFVSPRTGGPLTWVYGKSMPAGQLGYYTAYETTSTDGIRLVIATRGMFEKMDEAKFRSVFPGVP